MKEKDKWQNGKNTWEAYYEVLTLAKKKLSQIIQIDKRLELIV